MAKLSELQVAKDELDLQMEVTQNAFVMVRGVAYPNSYIKIKEFQQITQELTKGGKYSLNGREIRRD